MTSSRELWACLETLHDVVYFDPRIRQAGLDLGLRGFWMTYFAFRAAPLGATDAPLVVATFAGFAPTMVGKALPAAWALTTPKACLTARAGTSATALRACGADEEAFARAVPLLEKAVAAADPTGRPLFAANAALPLGDDPVAAVWQLTSTLREHRGDGHIAALVAAGISGLEAHVLQSRKRGYPAEALRGVRGWTEDEWAAAEQSLAERGIGAADLDEVERRTDAVWVIPSLLEGACALLAPEARKVRAAGILPALNPTGLPA